QRRYELDWLRVYAIFLLIAIHAAAIFDPFPVTAVKGRESVVMKMFAIFVHQWRLSILFLISGAGAYFALNSLGGIGFVRMRFRRILVPLLVGTIVVVPVHLYYWVSGLYPGRYSSYFDFYTQLLNNAVHGRIWTRPEYLHWAHLWFLAYLFIISAVTAPLLVFLRKPSNRARLARLTELCHTKTGLLLLPLVPLVVTELILRPLSPGDAGPNLINDWANVAMYLIDYLYGYLIYSDDALRASVKRAAPIALALAVLTTAITYLMGVSFGWILFAVLRTGNAWFWIVAILGFGIRYLNYTNKILPYANEAAYPIYVIHLPILSIVAYQVVKWNAPVAVQFIAIIAGTLICAIAIYALLIRQTRITRFLFGLKPRKRQSDQLSSTRPTPLSGTV
ncbi:MAG TPA: acyltransferase, partial [Pyrinomonadaceae bacterium]